MYGYAGNLLEINLDRGQVSTKELPPELARQYLGGIGFNARIVYDQVPAGTDALAPENVLVFSAGSLVGTPFPTAARVEASAKSPLTGGFGTSNSGSFWGARLKAAGYDSVIVKGRAERPVYISINNDRITVCDASALWGKDAWEVIDILKTRHYGAEVALIGPAGENLVRFASIENGYYDGWGRTGLGAVMGSKNLKAIVVQGTGSIVTADPVGLLNATRKGQELIKSASSYIPFSTYGTMNATIPYGNFNAISTHNFSRGTLPNWKETAGRQIVDTYGRRHIACQSCIIACGHLAQVTEGKYAGLKVKALEITPTASFSGNAGLDTAATIKAVELCQRYGVDMVGAGSLIAFATELYLKGIISKEDIGYELEFGNDEAAFKLLQDIVTRSGIGNILAEGTKRAASHFNGAKPYAMHVKGLELPMIDPRGRWSTWTLGMLTNIRGGDHLRCRNPVENLRYNENDPEKLTERFGSKKSVYDRLDMPPDLKEEVINLENDSVDIAGMSKWAEDLINLFNSLGVCIRPPVMEKVGPLILAEAFTATTGIEITARELIEAAERSWNLMKLFNLREGEDGNDLQFPPRFYKEAAGGQPLEEKVVKEVLKKYFQARGWDPESGRPTPATLTRLSLNP